MSDQNMPFLSNAAEPKRDSYGFTVRPQHLQRFREYGGIYKEEEEERSEKWKEFLEQCSESVQLLDHAEVASYETALVAENSKEGDDSSVERSASDSNAEGGGRKESSSVIETRRRNIQTWQQVRPSLASIEELMVARVKKKGCLLNDMNQVQKDQPIVPSERLSSCHEDFEEQLADEPQSEDSCIGTEAVQDPIDDKHTSDDSHWEGNLIEHHDQEMEENGAKLSISLENEESTAHKVEELDGKVDLCETAELFFPWKEELESLVHGGVPKSLRGEVWQAFVGVRSRRVEKYYQKLISLGEDSDDSWQVSGASGTGSMQCAPEKWKKQIEKDLPRTFPGHPALDEEGRSSLRRILTAYALHNPSVGYCQAMNFFAGLLLLLMPEENAFWTLVGIIDDYFDGYFTHEMIESQVDQLVFEDLMRERFPKLVNHFDYLGVEVAWVSGPWFLSIFVNMLPWESVLRVWDVILFEGNRVMLFRTALALMELYGPALVTTKDAGDAVTLLQSLTGSTFDSSQLVLTACMGFLGVTESRLEELRTMHRPSVLAMMEERTTGSQVSKDSKSIASKLYSFKHDPHSVIKDSNVNEDSGVQLNDSDRSMTKTSPDTFDEFICGLNIDSEIDSLPDLQEQVVWLKVELCRLMEEKRLATLRAEELETAFLEMVREDNRRELSARVEQLEQEVALLRQALADKQEQERAMLQVLMRVEQVQKDTEDARIAAEQELAAQKYEVHVLQEKYEKAMTSMGEMEKRVVIAESMLEATLQYQSGQAKAVSSPRSAPADSPQAGRKTGILSFGLGWRDRNKGD